MPTSSSERTLIVLLRLSLAWVFLYAASHQVLVKGWSVAGFLDHTKTFHWLYGPMAHSSLTPVITFLVEYGHLLIGLSLVSGLFVRASAPFGILLLILYWTAHMSFPFIGDPNNLLIDFHITYAFALGLCMVRHAGHAYGLDGLVARWRMTGEHPTLRWLTA